MNTDSSQINQINGKTELDGYQSYANEPPKLEDAKSLERDLKIQEFQDQRDIILKTLAHCIKQKNFTEAQEIYHQYQVVRKYDESFASLGHLLAEGLKKQEKISKYELLLDATPDDEYNKRIEYYNEILKIEPDNLKYLELKKQCRLDCMQNKAALTAIKKTNSVQKNNSGKLIVSIFFALFVIPIILFFLIFIFLLII